MLKIKKKYVIQSKKKIALIEEKIEKILQMNTRKLDLISHHDGNNFCIRSKLIYGEQAKGRILTELLRGYICVWLKVSQINNVIRLDVEISLRKQFYISLLISFFSGMVMLFIDIEVIISIISAFVMFLLTLCIGLISILMNVRLITDNLIEELYG